MWVGVDDTDARTGGCTTRVGLDLVEAIDRELLGRPRLVRLDPMAPWKTRGNGAVALRFAGDATAEVAERAWRVVTDRARPDADPGLVVLDDRPSRDLYEAAVTRLVAWDEVELPDGAVVFGGRGRLGAMAAVAWRPGDATVEHLVYREPGRCGTPRDVDPASVRAVAEEAGSAWDCYDFGEEEPVMVPNGPDPVLFGIRGDDADEVEMLADRVSSEPVAARATFLTNQGTDDHVVACEVADLAPARNVAVQGRVATEPRIVAGGHTFVDLDDGTGTCTLAAYEPTKRFRRVVRALREGDEVLAVGGTPDGTTVNLEKLHVDALTDVVETDNPRCCGSTMDSAGYGAGYRCDGCGRRVGEREAPTRRVDRGLSEGWHEVPPCARRHLAKPLKRF